MTLAEHDVSSPPVTTQAPARTPWRRLLQPYGQPLWVRPCVLALLAATAVLNVWGLGASGWANAFYSAAAQAGASNWTAFFFGSSDAANAITVDKTPLSLWVMDLSVRLFGLNPWSVLVPQALMGVATVGVLYGAVRRWYGPVAGLLAGAILALTPVAVLMFRFNNPDALLVLLLVLAVAAGQRALETASTRWLALAGALMGLGFLTKMLQALLVVPAIALTYLVTAPTAFGRRVKQLLIAGASMLVAGGWWVVIVEIIPASRRPFIGGSQHNSVLELTFGYNGFGRLDGEEVGSIGGRPPGQTGVDRLFTPEHAAGISWLMPAALVLAIAALWLTWNMPRTDPLRAGILLWGGSGFATYLTFSLMAGIFHAYYSVALAPYLGAVIGIGVALLWRQRSPQALVVLAATIPMTVIWAWFLMGRRTDFVPWLRPVIAVVGLGAALTLLLLLWRGVRHRLPYGRPRLALAGAWLAGLLACLGGPTAYSVATAATPHQGAIPPAGPVPISTGQKVSGPGGGLVDATTPSAVVTSTLLVDADHYTWVAATVGSNNAAGYQLATRRPVMAIGGFNGSDPSPTLAEFQRYVADGRIHYFIEGYRFIANGGSTASFDIVAWVTAHYPQRMVDGAILFDLTETPLG